MVSLSPIKEDCRTMTFLQLTGLQKRYGEVDAVDKVGLSIKAGTRTAIVGPSGSGKTTLLRLIAGFERPDAGRIVLDGETLADRAVWVPGHLRGIGIVAQEGALFPHLNIAENIGFGIADVQGLRSERICELLDLVGLDRSMQLRKPDQLSGGQQQRVALARALARKPRLMLLDEPFSALDTGLRASTRKAVAQVLEDAGITTILVTHDQTEALAFADQLAVMRDGKLVQVGPPRDIYLQPCDPVTAVFLGQAIILAANVTRGQAECALGRIDVADRDFEGAARIMLRPEQLLVRQKGLTGLSKENDAEAITGRVEAVEFCGATYDVSVCVEKNAAAVKTSAASDPAVRLRLSVSSLNPLNIGDRLQIEVNGAAHLFDSR
jgi:iron(III) transport system ATP-binding protein